MLIQGYSSMSRPARCMEAPFLWQWYGAHARIADESPASRISYGGNNLYELFSKRE